MMVLSQQAIRFAQARRNAPQRQRVGTGIVKTTEAPWRGLNTRDAYDNLKPDEARQLINWFPGDGGLEVRMGYSSWATGVGSGDVATLAELNSGGVRKFIAFSSTAAYDITTTGAGSSIKSGLTASGRWDWDQMEGVIGFVDGINAPQKWDGTTWAALTVTGPTLPIGIKVHKNRSYFWDDDSDSFWYSADKALGGNCTQFRLGAVVGGFGKVVAIESWTVDGGAGPDDLAVFMGSGGKVVVYSGFNPGDSSWSIVGVYDFGQPLSRDSATKLGGDLVIQTSEDYVRITAETLRAGQAERQRSKMSGILPKLARLYSGNSGWGGLLYPNAKHLIFNIPFSATRFDQHVLNTTTGAWGTYKDIPARVWGLFNDNAYFGAGNGVVYKFWDTNADAGMPITWEAQTAWNTFGDPRVKTFKGVRPVLTVDGSITFGAGMAYDFGTTFTTQTVSSSTQGTEWDTASWGDDWASEIVPKRSMFGATGSGITSSLQLKGATTNINVRWYRTDYLYERGGVI